MLRREERIPLALADGGVPGGSIAGFGLRGAPRSQGGGSLFGLVAVRILAVSDGALSPLAGEGCRSLSAQ